MEKHLNAPPFINNGDFHKGVTMEKNGKLAGMDLLASIFFIALGAGTYLYSAKMKVYQKSLIISPGLFPMLLGGIFVLCGAVLMIMALKRGGIADCRRLFSGSHIGSILHNPTFWRGTIVFVLILLYVALFGNPYLAKLNFVYDTGIKIIPVNVGFLLVTAGYLFVTFVYLKAMKWYNALMVSLIAAVAIYYAFNQGFGIPIP